MDELASLDKLPQLHTGTTENCKYGNSMVLGRSWESFRTPQPDRSTIKIENDQYMPLTIENTGLSPRGLPASPSAPTENRTATSYEILKYMSMQIESGKVKKLHAYYFRNDYAGME